jgi:transcription antitermination factor NusG
LGPIIVLLWYVGRTKSSLEFFAQDNLRDQGFTTFLPTYRKLTPPRTQSGNQFTRSIKNLKQHALSSTSGSALTELVPLFPRYIFIQFDQDDAHWCTDAFVRWPAINSTRGMTKLLCDAAANPQPVPGRIMERLLARATPSGEIDLSAPEPLTLQFTPNTPVRIIDQEGIDAIFRHYESDTTRARIFLSIFGGIETTIDSSRLEAAA